MADGKTGRPRRVLIASANPLFGKGLQKIFIERWGKQAVVVGLTSSMAETLAAMESLQPDLVIVDYDDKILNRAEFLNHFMAGDRPMQVMLVSLRGGGAAVVYDRQALTPSEAEDWLNLPNIAHAPAEKQIPPRRNEMRRFVFLGILVILLSILVYAGLVNARILPVEASLQAVPIDWFFHFHFAAIAFLFSLIFVFMVYSMIAFRRRPGETGDGRHISGNTRLELTWTIIPLITVLAVATIGAQNLAETRQIDPQAMVVNVTGGQWFWSFEYPGTGVTSSTLYLPVNKQILFRLTSKDVIHSFWVPEFRIKQDALPGANLVRELRLTPDQTGKFKVRCAEMCGVSHAYMESLVVVVSQTEFSAWLQQQQAAASKDPVARGQVLATVNGCLSCHSTDGTIKIGPSFKGLYGSQVILSDGSTRTADENYIKTSIIDPRFQIVKGFESKANVMPTDFGKKLNDQQIQDLVEFIRSLR
ncbi:MAG TPA: cytochrome c oxidase subunit II [Anaerolineaceae bacterium]|nr:cytochrome c oxidase subunit II [Anaerolineaceae bacterium]